MSGVAGWVRRRSDRSMWTCPIGASTADPNRAILEAHTPSFLVRRADTKHRKA